MKGRDLLEGLSFIDERFVEEAEHGLMKKRHWLRIAAMAACLCVIVGAAFGLQRIHEPMEGEVTGSPEMMPEIVTEGSALVDGNLETAMGAERSLVLTVDQWLENGFLGTVVKTVGELEAGIQVEVRRGTDAVWNLPDGTTRVVIRGYTYDPEENVVYAELIGKDE